MFNHLSKYLNIFSLSYQINNPDNKIDINWCSFLELLIASVMSFSIFTAQTFTSFNPKSLKECSCQYCTDKNNISFCN